MTDTVTMLGPADITRDMIVRAHICGDDKLVRFSTGAGDEPIDGAITFRDFKHALIELASTDPLEAERSSHRGTRHRLRTAELEASRLRGLIRDVARQAETPDP
jgi:hypothetical protein